MIKTVAPGERYGAVRIPSSKSIVHRLLICAAMGAHDVVIRYDGLSRDIQATADCLAALGAEIRTTEEELRVSPLVRRENTEKAILPAGESGSTLRFLIPATGVLGRRADFIMEGRLAERPMAPFDRLLREHGMSLTRDGQVLHCEGQLEGGLFCLPGNVSSQYFSGLLMALPWLGCDWSNAAFFLCSAALSGQGIRVSGLNPASGQGDRQILQILREFGAEISVGKESVSVREGCRRPIEVDAMAIPDLVPVLAILCCSAEGSSRITGAARLRWKESDRLTTTTALIRSLGGEAEELPDGIVIHGTGRLRGGTAETFNDHRIAMSAAMAAVLCSEPVTVLGAECVGKSYPAFWRDYEALELARSFG